jgi:hypothetical protein
VLDSWREAGWVQYRSTPPRGDLMSGLAPFAGPGFGGISFDSAANGGYLQVEMTSLRWARRVDAELRRRGLLDVSAILPTYDRFAQLRQVANSLQAPLAGALTDCHATYGNGIDIVVISLASVVTRQEVAALDRALAHLNAWAVIERGGVTECTIY